MWRKIFRRFAHVLMVGETKAVRVTKQMEIGKMSSRVTETIYLREKTQENMKKNRQTNIKNDFYFTDQNLNSNFKWPSPNPNVPTFSPRAFHRRCVTNALCKREPAEGLRYHAPAGVRDDGVCDNSHANPDTTTAVATTTGTTIITQLR